jgi:PAS domain S-box-containing protein
LTGLKGVVGKKVSEVIPGLREANPELLEIYGRVALTGEPERFETYVGALGIHFSVVVYSPRQEHFVAVFDNITERKRAEETLRENEERFRATFEQAAVGIAHVAPDGRWLRVNQRLCDIVGYSREELTRLTFQDITHPDDLDADLQYVRQMLADEIASYSMEKRYVRKNGRHVWINLTVALLRDATGQPKYFISVVEDITARKLAEAAAQRAQQQLLDQRTQEKERVETELGKLREELVRKTRLAAIGQVSASIAHDLRNPLGSVRNAAFYLKRRVPKDPPEWAEFLDVIEKEVGEADRIISNLLEMGRAGPVRKHAVDLRQLAEDAFQLIKDRDGIQLRVATDPEPFAIHAAPDAFRQVLMNLGTNAVQAMAGKGELWVQARRNAAGDEILVRDTGPGIAGYVRERLFEPLVTTKAKGTGLGLAICRQIVERHGGTITLISEDRPGATFRIVLPRDGEPDTTEQEN